MIGWVIINSSFISYVSKVTIFTSPSGTVLQSVAKRRSVRRADRLDRNRRPVPTEWTSYRGLYTFTYPVPANATRIPGLSILCSLHPFLYFLRVDFVVRVCHSSPKQGFATIRVESKSACRFNNSAPTSQVSPSERKRMPPIRTRTAKF